MGNEFSADERIEVKRQLQSLEHEIARLRYELGGIANACEYLSLELCLRKSGLTIHQWAQAVLDNALYWEMGVMKIKEVKHGD